jgi:pimeloyl-ACP methyl ester carboxylesterase
MRTVCFSHGKESGPWGTKIKVLADVADRSGWAVESIDYQGVEDPHDRVDLLRTWCAQQDEAFVLVGSSMGGHVAAAAATEYTPLGLFLMAPAFFVDGYEEYTPAGPDCPFLIMHGKQDEVIPWQNSVRFSSEAQNSEGRVVLLDSDHRLVDALPEIAEQFQIFLNQMDERYNA